MRALTRKTFGVSLVSSWFETAPRNQPTLSRVGACESSRSRIRTFSSQGSAASDAPSPSDWYRQHPSVIDVTSLADSLRRNVREYTQRNSLKLVGILANQGPHRHDSELYSERIQDTFIEDGIDYELWRCPSGGGDPSADGIRRIQDQIRRANQRDDIHGVLIFYPIYPHGPKGPYKNRITGVYYKTHDDHLRDLVDPTKDVEGLGGTKWFNIRDRHPFQQLPLVYPCTALSVVQIIEKHHILKGSATSSWQDQTIAIVNRSEIMGRPLAAMLAQKGATVYSIDIDSILQFRPNGRLHLCSRTATSLESCLQESQVVVTGVPSTGFRLPIPSIAESTTLINVSEFPNVCELTLVTERPDVQYIPQVGKVTVAVLENNLMNLRIAVASSEQH